MEAAALEFCEHSYFGTDTNQIARRAGFASGSFYNHFVDKFDVFLQLFIEYADRERSEVFAELATVDIDDAAAFRRLAARLVASRRTLARFRASLEMLTRTEERIVEARRMNQAKTILRITGLPATRVPKAVRSAIGLRFLLINAITDCLTSARSLTFGISESDALGAVTLELRTIARLAQSTASADATRQ
jgi:AcrR family transcriptional regulator